MQRQSDNWGTVVLMINFSRGISRVWPRGNRGRGLLTVCAAGVCLVFAGCASDPEKRFAANSHAEAKAAYQTHDYQRTLTIVEPQATAGAAWAQYTLGFMYYYGRGVRIDRPLARQWIQQAAAQNYPPAQEALRRLPPLETPAGELAAATPRNNGSELAPPGLAARAPLPAAPAPVLPQILPHPETPVGQDGVSAVAAQTGGPGMETAPPVPVAQEPVPAAPVAAMPPVEAPPAPVSVLPPEPVVTAPVTSPEPVPPPVSSVSVTSPPPASPLAVPPGGDERGNQWIVRQDPGRLTLQLIGSSDRAAITRYIREHGLEKEAASYITNRAGRPWYVVVYGSYDDLTAARSALSGLPPALRSASPWIRPFADIQQQINTAPP